MGFRWLKRPHRRWEEAASAYVDAELADGALRRFESHMAGCQECRERVDGLRLAKASIAGLPEVAAPRSFRLTPAMLEEPVHKPVNAAPSWGFRGAAMVAAVAAVAFVSVIAIDLSRSSSDSASHAVPTLNESSRQGTFSTASGVAAGASAQDSAAPPAIPTPSPATKGIASPDIGGTGAQTLPTAPNASPVPGSTQPQAPLTGPGPSLSPDVTSSNAYAATATTPGVLVPATGAPDNEQDEGEPYRPFEAGLAALAIGAALGAALMYRRKGRS